MEILHIDRGDRGVDTIQNIKVGELSDRSRVDVLEDCLVEKSFSGTDFLDWRAEEDTL